MTTFADARRKLQARFDGKVEPSVSEYIGAEWERVTSQEGCTEKQAMLLVDDLIERLTPLKN